MWKKTTTILSITLIGLALIAFVLIDNLSVKTIPNVYAQSTGPAATPQPTHTLTPNPTATPCALVSLAPSTMVVSESSGTVMLSVNLDRPQGISVDVTLSSEIILPDYATDFLDYGTISPVTFQPGEQTKQIAITIIQDVQTEPNESFNVIISSVASGCAIINTAANQSQITILDDDFPTNTPLPTNTSAPTDTDTPVPADTDTPVPTDTDTPIPADTDTPVPANTNTPIPADTDTPVPANTDAPVLANTNTPIPADTDTPVPANTDTPVPANTNTPVPADTDTPVPADTDTPVSANTNTPIPADTDTPVPEDTDTPVPANTNTPVPADTDTPVPANTNTPVPADTHTPVPADTDTPVPANTNTPIPADTDTPVPTDTDTPVPANTDTPVPADTDTPLPTNTDTNTPVPADTDTPVPADTITPIPTETRVPPPQNPDIDLNIDPINDPADVFDPEGAEPEEVAESADPETGESTDPRLGGIIYRTKVRGENRPNDRNEREPILPGGIAIFEIRFENNSLTPLYGVVIRMVIPPFTFFRLDGSGIFPLAQVTAAEASAEGNPPIFAYVTTNLHQNRGTEWELADGSGPCPDGAPAGTECIFRLGTVLPGESGELSIPTKVDEEAPTGETFELGSTLAAANLDEGLLIALNDPAGIETVSQLPTNLPAQTEPGNRLQIYLPFITH